MRDRFWLVQRGTFNSNLTDATQFFGHDGLIDLDYMGSAEFEWGAIPKAFRRIMGQRDQYALYITDFETIGGVPFCVFCRKDRYDKVLDAIKKYLDGGYGLKEYSNMREHFKVSGRVSLTANKYTLRTNFWWCIDKADIGPDVDEDFDNLVGDWIAFTGATDRQKAFLRAIDSDYNNWWLKNYTEEEREKEFKNSFCWP